MKKCYLGIDYFNDEEMKRIGLEELGKILYKILDNHYTLYREELINMLMNLSNPVNDIDPTIRVIREEELNILKDTSKWMSEEFTSLLKKHPEKFKNGRDAMTEEEKKILDGGESHMNLVGMIQTVEHLKDNYDSIVDVDNLRIVCFIHDFQDEDEEKN